MYLYEIEGGSVVSRVWRFATSEQAGGPGALFTSTGGVNWTKVTDFNFSTYGRNSGREPPSLYMWVKA